MATQFLRTTRSLKQDSSALAYLAWGFAAVLLAAWLAWFTLGEVTVYEVSRSARLEVQQSAHPVAAPVAGKVTGNRMVLGQQVRAGDVLMTLDAGREVLRLQEEQSRLAAYEPRIASLNREVAALTRALAEDKSAATAAISSARARAREAAAAVEFAKDNERRLRDESRTGGVAQIEAVRAASETAKLSAALDALGADIVRIENDARTRASQHMAQLESLQRAIVTLEGERVTTQSTMDRLTQDMEQYVVRAPVDGVIAEISPLRSGTYLNLGEKVATVVPRGGMVVVASFPPAAVLGRMHAGQRGQLRLDGFPWTEFGSIEVQVQSVASEIRDQTVRVELLPVPGAGSRIVMQHGLPGAVEIGIERTSPAILVLRALGQISPDGMLAAARADAART